MLATGLLLWTCTAAAVAVAAASSDGFAERNKATVAVGEKVDVDYDLFRRPLAAKRVPKTLGRMIGRRLFADSEIDDEALASTGARDPTPFARDSRAPTRQHSSFVRIGRQVAFGGDGVGDEGYHVAQLPDGSSRTPHVTAPTTTFDVHRRGGLSSFIRIGRGPVEYDNEGSKIDALVSVLLADRLRGRMRCDDDDDDDNDRLPVAAAAAARRRCLLMDAVVRELGLQLQEQLDAAPRRDFGDDENVGPAMSSSPAEVKRGQSSFIRLGRSTVGERKDNGQRTIDNNDYLKTRLEAQLAKSSADGKNPNTMP